eukprot:278065-Chlamydomonas_euryale.AAC.1
MSSCCAVQRMRRMPQAPHLWQIELDHVHQLLHTFRAERVRAKLQRRQRGVALDAGRKRLDALVADVVAAQVERRQHLLHFEGVWRGAAFGRVT